MKKLFTFLLALTASVGMSFAQASIVSSGTKGGMSYTFYDNGLLEISGSGALPGNAFTNWDGGFGASVKNIRFAKDCEVYGLDYLWFACYTENSQLETVEINSVAPIMFSGASGAGIFYRQDGAVTLTITAPAIVDVESEIIDNYGSPVNMIFNMPATTVFEKKWFSGLRNNFAVTIPTGAKGHIPAGYVFKNPYDQKDYEDMVAHGMEDMFWEMHSYLTEGVDYTFVGEESTFVITAENASQIFGQAAVSFQAPTEASNSEWVLWRKSDLKEFPDMSSGDQKVCKDVTVKVNNGVYNTDSGYGLHLKSLAEDGVQFVAPEGKVFKRIVILNGYGTFSDPNWSYDGNYKKWSGSANTVGFEGDICGISLIEFELGEPGDDPEPVAEYAEIIFTEAVAKDDLAADASFGLLGTDFSVTITDTDNKMSIDGNSCRFGGAEDYKSYSHRLKTGGKSSSKNFITLNIPAAGKIRLAVRSGNNDATDRNLVITQGEKELYNAVIQESMATEVTEGETQVKVYPYVEVAVAAGTVRLTYPVNGLNFYSFGFMEDSTATGVDEIANGKSQTIKVIRDGQLLIEKNGKIYNVQGVEVR